jgi:hypothetical protein
MHTEFTEIWVNNNRKNPGLHAETHILVLGVVDKPRSSNGDLHIWKHVSYDTFAMNIHVQHV